MNALLADGLHLKVQEKRDVSHQVLDEHGIVVRPHGNMVLIGAFEQGLNGC